MCTSFAVPVGDMEKTEGANAVKFKSKRNMSLSVIHRGWEEFSYIVHTLLSTSMEITLQHLSTGSQQRFLCTWYLIRGSRAHKQSRKLLFCPPQCLHQSAKVKGSKKPSSANGTRAEVLRPHKSETWHQLRREQAGVYACRAALHGGTNMTPNGKLCLEELEEKLQSATHAKICFAPKKRVGRQKTLTVI